MGDAVLDVEPRVVTGKKVKALRRQGIVPAHLYGYGTESVAVQAERQRVINMLRSVSRNAIIDLRINGEGKPRPVVLRSVQRDPVTGDLVHIDFFQISLTQKLKADVPLHFVGEPPAVTIHGGVLLHSVDSLSVEALPGEIPPHIEVDVGRLDTLDSALFVRDLAVPAGLEVLSDPDQVVAKVASPRLVAEEERPAEAPSEEAPEGAPAAEGVEEKAEEE